MNGKNSFYYDSRIFFWAGSDIDEALWALKYRFLRDCLEKASTSLDSEHLGYFLVLMWECRNARSHFIFKKAHTNLEVMGKRALDFVRSYRETQEQEAPSLAVTHLQLWRLPLEAYTKLNFDGGCIGEAT